MKRRSGGAMVTWGIVVLIGSLFVTCGVSATRANRADPYGDGFNGAAAPMAIGMVIGVALIGVGSAKKSNANREWQDRMRQAATTTELVPTDKVPGGPFRGALEEVRKVDPVFQAMEDREREDRRRRGGTYLLIGGLLLGFTALGLVYLITSGSHASIQARFERLLLGFGACLLPFGIGLWLTIKGGIMRSKG
jgi:hypothetical protein